MHTNTQSLCTTNLSGKALMKESMWLGSTFLLFVLQILNVWHFFSLLENVFIFRLTNNFWYLISLILFANRNPWSYIALSYTFLASHVTVTDIEILHGSNVVSFILFYAFFGGVGVAHIFNFLYYALFLFCCVCLSSFCVFCSQIANVCELSILDCPFGFV
jgi:hypothetical protein